MNDKDRDILDWAVEKLAEAQFLLDKKGKAFKSDKTISTSGPYGQEHK